MTDQQQDTPSRDDFTDAARVALDSVRRAWAPIRDAFTDLWRGPFGQAVRRREAMLRARRAHKASGYRDHRFDPFPPSGCALCGLSDRDHYQRWARPVGWHQHVPPTAAHILDRMRARRADRQSWRAAR